MREFHLASEADSIFIGDGEYHRPMGDNFYILKARPDINAHTLAACLDSSIRIPGGSTLAELHFPVEDYIDQVIRGLETPSQELMLGICDALKMAPHDFLPAVTSTSRIPFYIFEAELVYAWRQSRSTGKIDTPTQAFLAKAYEIYDALGSKPLKNLDYNYSQAIHYVEEFFAANAPEEALVKVQSWLSRENETIKRVSVLDAFVGMTENQMKYFIAKKFRSKVKEKKDHFDAQDQIYRAGHDSLMTYAKYLAYRRDGARLISAYLEYAETFGLERAAQELRNDSGEIPLAIGWRFNYIQWESGNRTNAIDVLETFISKAADLFQSDQACTEAEKDYRDYEEKQANWKRALTSPVMQRYVAARAMVQCMERVLGLARPVEHSRALVKVENNPKQTL